MEADCLTIICELQDWETVVARASKKCIVVQMNQEEFITYDELT
jgi:hypothetical protein